MSGLIRQLDVVSGQVGHLLKDPVMLLIRLYWGYNLINNGYEKLSNTSKTSAYFHSIGLPGPVGYLTGLVELITGVHYLLGFTSEFATLLVVVVTLNAYIFAHTNALLSIFTNPSHFINQPPFLFLLTALFIHYAGPGRLSLDYAVFNVASPSMKSKYE